jgi:hypothetical protein
MGWGRGDHPHLVSEGQKVVVDQNRGRRMVIMLQTRVTERDSLSSTTEK